MPYVLYAYASISSLPASEADTIPPIDDRGGHKTLTLGMRQDQYCTNDYGFGSCHGYDHKNGQFFEH